jgi:hypothetical protein
MPKLKNTHILYKPSDGLFSFCCWCDVYMPACAPHRGWNQVNECRCKGCPTWKIQNWIDQIAPFVKSLDSKHLVGIGHEGFYGPDSSKTEFNPGGDKSDWAAKEGQVKNNSKHSGNIQGT